MTTWCTLTKNVIFNVLIKQTTTTTTTTYAYLIKLRIMNHILPEEVTAPY